MESVIQRRSFSACIVLLAVGSALPSLAQEAWPARPVRMIVGFGAGGSADILARDIAQRLTQRLGQTVFVDNRPGAASTIANAAVAHARPDGYTIGLISSHFAASPRLYPAAGYTIDSFTPIALLANVPGIVVVNSDLKITSIQQLVASAKAKPGFFTYASTGSGGVTHLATEMFKAAAGIDVTHVPFKTNQDALLALIRGDVSMMFDSPSTSLPHIRDGKLIPIAWTSLQRGAVLPQVPTIAESGYPGFSAIAWFGMVAPANLPRPVADRLARELQQILETPDLAAKIRSQGLDPVSDSTVDKFGTFLHAEAEKWGAIVTATGATVD